MSGRWPVVSGQSSNSYGTLLATDHWATGHNIIQEARMRNTLALGLILLIVGCSDNKNAPSSEALYREGHALETKPNATRQDFMAARDDYTQALQLQCTPEL